MPPRMPDTYGLAVRVGIFAFLEIVGLIVFGTILTTVEAGSLIAAVGSTFLAAFLTNLFTARIFERMRLSDLGLGWNEISLRHTAFGVAAGIGAALLVLLPPLVTGAARLVEAPEQPANVRSIVFIAVVLIFGALGEELLFRGYGFQLLLRRFGAPAVIIPSAALFALAHLGNLNASWPGALNTFLWGLLLGYAIVRSGDLWLATGLHYGWNLTLPMFGVNLSGFTMGVTGYRLDWSAGPLWSGGEYGVEASVLTSLVIPLVGLYLWKAPVRTQLLALLAGPPEKEIAAHVAPPSSDPSAHGE